MEDSVHFGRNGHTNGEGAGVRTYIISLRMYKRSFGTAHLRLDESISLARSIDLCVVEGSVIGISRIHAAYLLGRGKVSELKSTLSRYRVELVIIDFPLSPVQQRNLERMWRIKVLDRTSLILEIFGRRARTREGRLQVELAHLDWQRSRLVRSWTHLERQRGGFGFMGGPGETQIESDRRHIRRRIVHLRRSLEKVRRTRSLHRFGRRRSGRKVIALVGYTNAGKSTLFNVLTGADVLAGDMLFATLDPTMRHFDLGDGYGGATLIDTVGFISDLPTTLVAAFRATLEDVREADLILHVRDISNPSHDMQAQTVLSILSDLDVDVARVLDVYNKSDRIDISPFAPPSEGMERKFIHVSALKKQGLDALKEWIIYALRALPEYEISA